MGGRTRARLTGVAASFIVGSITLADPAAAGGFANPIQSATAAATATAGATAEAVDASVVFYNPAGMTRLRRPELGVASGFIWPKQRFRNDGTVDATGTPMRGSGGPSEDIQYLPSLFGVLPVDERLSVGLGLYSPFGQRNEYDASWVGRYHTFETALTTVEIGPSISYRLAEWISLGASVGIQYARFDRKNAVDFGSICFGSLGPGACAGLGLLPQGADGASDVELDDWSGRFTLGMLVEPAPGTRAGLVYRSPTRHDFEGSAQFTVPAAAAPITAGGAFRNTAASASLTFPESVSLGIAQTLTEALTLLADVTWTRWGRLDELTLRFANPAQPALSQPLDWQDSWRIALGAAYQLTETTMLRGGIAFDQSPVQDAFRTPDLPENDRIELGLGVVQRAGKFLLGFSYTYARERDAAVRSSMTGAGTLAGEFERESHSVGLQVGVVF